MIDKKILDSLNAPEREERLAALGRAVKEADFPPMRDCYINNHIHTTYSFSPYSPTAAVFAARSEGLCTAGIIDHDSIAGAREFLQAGDIVGIPTTIGMECRVSMAGTPLAEKRINNPDQVGVAYVTFQGVPHDKIEYLNDYFAPYRQARNRRTKAMAEKINGLLDGINLDFERDVVPLSMYRDGGGITERHLMLALARAMTEKVGRGAKLVEYLGNIGVELSEKQKKLLLDTGYQFYDYDLLGIFKSAFLQKVFIPATDECMHITDAVKLCGEVGAVLCYAYLGDVGDSVTGDKKAQKFEDDFLEELFACLKELKVPAVTYMPTRNTKEQLTRLRALCDEYGMLQVSGEDINSPRQSFVIKAMEDPMFANLIDSTWKLIRHEQGEPVI